MTRPKKVRKCTKCDVVLPMGTRPQVRRCDRCKAHDPHRNSTRKARNPMMFVAVDCESEPNPAKYDAHWDMYENDMISFSYAREDGTSDTLMADPGEFLTFEEVMEFLFEELARPYETVMGDVYRQVPIAFHFNHDTGMLLKHFWERMELVQNSKPTKAENRPAICGKTHREGEECDKPYHRYDQDQCRGIVRGGGEGMVLAYDPTSKYAVATTPNRRFYAEYRPNGDRFDGVKRLDIHDVGKTFQGTLETAIETWRPRLRPRDRENIAWGKAQRATAGDSNGFQGQDRLRVAEYSESECYALAQLMRKVHGILRDSTGLLMDENKMFGAGSIAVEVMKFNGVPRRDDVDTGHDVFIGGTTVEALSHMCYFGGLIETPVVGLMQQPGKPRDITSAYPSKMVTLPCMRQDHGKWTKAKANRYELLPEHTIGYALVSWYVEEGQTEIPPFMVRDKKSSVFCPRTGRRVWVPLAELRTAMERFPDVVLNVHQLVYWAQTCECLHPMAYLADIFQSKADHSARSKDETLPEADREEARVTAELFKLIINSSYGKLAQRNPTMGPYTNLHWAMQITAETRAQVRIEAWNVEADNGTVLYVHTDSVTATVERPSEGKTLGSWTKENDKPNLLLIQPGFAVATGIDPKAAAKKSATRGVRKSEAISKALEYAENKELPSVLEHWEPLEMTDTRMLSLRYAHHINRPWLAGSFTNQKVVLHFKSAKRDFDSAVPFGPEEPHAWKVPPRVVVPDSELATIDTIKSYRVARQAMTEAGQFD